MSASYDAFDALEAFHEWHYHFLTLLNPSFPLLNKSTLSQATFLCHINSTGIPLAFHWFGVLTFCPFAEAMLLQANLGPWSERS